MRWYFTTPKPTLEPGSAPIAYLIEIPAAGCADVQGRQAILVRPVSGRKAAHGGPDGEGGGGICRQGAAVTPKPMPSLAYDIADSRRWRRVFKTMNGFGEWLQLSVFQCRLSRRRRAELETRLRELVKPGEDHVLLIDIGPADRTELAVESIGRTFAGIERRAVVV